MTPELILEFQFSAAHFYKNNHWSDEKNRNTFGKCFDPFGHGHDYRVSVKIKKSSLVSPLEVRNHIEEKLSLLDHHHLNHEIAYFREHVPTTENITLYLSTLLLAPNLYELIEIQLMEEPRIGATWLRTTTSSVVKS